MAQPNRDLNSLLALSTSLQAQSTAVAPREDATADTPTSAPQPAARKLDTGVLDALMGKSDAVRMRECMDFIDDATADEAAKGSAWDELEMIVENLDCANDLEPLGLWPRIARYLSSPSDETLTAALWTCGTAVNNNPRSQAAFLKLDPLPVLVQLPTTTDRSAEVRSKALFCISGLLKHFPDAIQRFTELGGFRTLATSLQDPDITCRRKTAFLVGALLGAGEADPLRPGLIAEARQAGVISSLVASLSPATAHPFGPDGDETSDADFEEKAVHALFAIATAEPGALLPDERRALAEALRSNDYGLARAELAQLNSLLS